MVLCIFWFGNSFIDWTPILYSSPSSSVKTYDQISPRFNLHRDIHQGSPLSPSLSAVIEPLTAYIWQNKDIEGFQTKIHKSQDQSLCRWCITFLQSSQALLSGVVALINEFSSASAYSVNWFKSLILPLTCRFQPRSSIPVQPGNTKPVVINISSKLSKNGSSGTTKCVSLFSRQQLSIHEWI